MANEFVARNGLIAQNNSIITGSLNVTAGITGSLLGTASWTNNAVTSSYANNLTVAGTLTAQTIVAQTITSSTEWITGSTKFGNIVSNTHQFTGSVGMTGSLNVVGNGITGSLLGTSSYAITASYAMNGGGGGGSTFPYTGDAVISGSLTVSKGNPDAANTNGANSHILLNNTSSVGQTSISSVINGKLAGKWRTDYIGGNIYVSSGSQGYHSFYTGGDFPTGSMRLFISSSGNIGIGTQTPSAKLQVSGTTTINGEWDGNFTNGLHLAFGGPNTGSIYSLQNGTAWRRLSIGGDPIVLFAGNVGISVDNPAYNLDVSGSINFTGNLYQNGSPFGGGSGSAFPYTGSAGINGDLSVHNTTGTTVASFEGVNGFPIKIITTSGSLTVGYSASLGSIGNGDGILYLKTGSSDPDWAPISYDNHLVQSTQYGIDLSAGDFTISGSGIYELVDGSSNDLIFPDPDSFIGQRIVVINTDGSNAANIDNTNTWAPYTAGTGTQLGAIGVENMWEFVSINSKWRGIKSGK